jgi:hypothetical protein
MRTLRRGHRRPHRGLGRPPSSQPGKGYPPAGPGRAPGRARFTLHFSECRIHQRKSAAWAMCRVSWWWHQSINDRF